MKIVNLATVAVAAVAVVYSIAVVAADSGSGQRSGRPMGPPPEAFAVCDGKTAGDAVSITLPDGRTISGSCQLMFRPDAPPAQ